MLSFLQAIIGDMVSMVAVVSILAGIIKVFQIATSLNEIKDLLADIKRNTHDYPGTASAMQPFTGRDKIAEPASSAAYSPAVLEHEL